MADLKNKFMRLAAVLAASAPAFLLQASPAIDTFEWSYNAGSIEASGTLTAVADGNGNYEILGGSGTRTGGFDLTIQPLLGACVFEDFSCNWPEDADGTVITYDNLLFANPVNGSQLDDNGILMTGIDPTTQASVIFNVYGSPDQEFNDGPNGAGWSVVNLTGAFSAVEIGTQTSSIEPVTTPEPGTMALGGLCLGAVALRRGLLRNYRARPALARRANL